MKVEFTNSMGNSTATISIQKVVATNGPAVRSICISCGYEMKDQAKEWAKKYGGSWHPVLKVWYVPLDGSKSQAIEVTKKLEEFGLINKYCYVFIDDRADVKYNESLKRFFLSVFPEEQTPPMGTVYDIHDVYPGDKEYISDPLYYIKEVGEIEQPQGYIDFSQEKHFRVLISYSEQITPEDEMEMAWGTYWREFKLENGDKVWCFPHSNPNIRFDNGEPWPDHVFEKDKDEVVESYPDPEREPDLKVNLLKDKEGKKTGFALSVLAKGHRWESAKTFCKVYGEWLPEKKYWKVELTKLSEKSQKTLKDQLVDLFNGEFNYQGSKNLLADFSSSAEVYLDELIDKFKLSSDIHE